MVEANIFSEMILFHKEIVTSIPSRNIQWTLLGSLDNQLHIAFRLTLFLSSVSLAALVRNQLNIYAFFSTICCFTISIFFPGSFSFHLKIERNAEVRNGSRRGRTLLPGTSADTTVSIQLHATRHPD